MYYLILVFLFTFLNSAPTPVQGQRKSEDLATVLVRSLNVTGLDVNTLINSQTRVAGFARCMLDLGECDAIGLWFRSRAFKLLSGECKRCSQRQKTVLRYLVKFLKIRHTDAYVAVYSSYKADDPRPPDFIAYFLQNFNVSGLDVNELLAADNRGAKVARCLLDLEPCDNLGFWLRARILAIFEGKCDRCSPRQKKVIQRIVNFIQDNQDENEEESTLQRVLSSYKEDEPMQTDVFAILLQTFNLSSLNVDELLSSDTRGAAIGRCLLSLGDCDGFGKWLRGRLSFALQGDCGRLCGRRLKKLLNRVVEGFKTAEPDTFFPIYEAWMEDQGARFDFPSFLSYLFPRPPQQKTGSTTTSSETTSTARSAAVLKTTEDPLTNLLKEESENFVQDPLPLSQELVELDIDYRNSFNIPIL